MRLSLLAVVPATVVAGALYWATRSPITDAAEAASSQRQNTTQAARMLPGLGGDAHGDVVRQSRWRVDYEHRVTLGGQTVDPTRVQGVWGLAPIDAQRRAGRFDATLIEGAERLPDASHTHLDFEIGLDAGRLDTLGFAPRTDADVASVVTTLAVAFSYTPGEGDSWSVEEEDRAGWYTAKYHREGDRVERTRGAYTRLRGGALPVKTPNAITASGTTTFHLEAEQVIGVEVDETLTLVLHEELPKVEVHVSGRMEQLPAKDVAWQPGRFSLQDIQPERAPDQGEAMARRDEGLLEGVDVDTLIQSGSDPLLAEDTTEARSARIRHFKRLTAIARTRPDRVLDIAEEARRNADNPRTFGMMVGALASAGTPDAVNAVAGLVDNEMPDTTRSRLIATLGTAEPMTEDALTVITDAMNEDDPVPGAELAAGNAAKTLEEQGNEDPSEDLIDQLIGKYQGATELSERVMLLAALGNTGSSRILPVVEPALQDPDGRIQAAATLSLRFVPDLAADELLEKQLGHNNLGIQAAAVRAVEGRDRTFWRPRLEAARETAPDALVAVINKVLRVWSTNTADPVARR